MYFDISCNASDNMFCGIYNDVQKHELDIDNVMQRSKKCNVIPFFVGTDLQSSIACHKYAQKYNTYSYVGLHPNSATTNKDDLQGIVDYILHNKMQDKTDMSDLRFFDTAIHNNIVAVGECGLDYYKSHATKQDQKHAFTTLLDLQQPRYFVHSRESHRDMVEILSDYNTKIVIHSFDGSTDEAKELTRLGYYISVNGHTTKGSIDVIEEIDIDRMMIESDAPYCSIGTTYEGYKHVKTKYEETKKYDKNKIHKRRNEPCKTAQVAEVISAVKSIDIDKLQQILHNNTITFYDIADKK